MCSIAKLVNSKPNQEQKVIGHDAIMQSNISQKCLPCRIKDKGHKMQRLGLHSQSPCGTGDLPLYDDKDWHAILGLNE